jgi:uncharacterized membrane protein YkvA (DUF1232 family)
MKVKRVRNKKGENEMRQLIILAIVIIYWGAHADMIPDVIPIAGQIDEVIATLFGLRGMA